MKKKKIMKYIILIGLLFSVFGIYQLFKTDKINYIALGDSVAEGMNPYGEVGYSYADYFADSLKEKNKLSYYTKKYAKSGYTTVDLMKQIEINASLKKDLRESDLVTLSIGANDFLKQIQIRSLDITNLLELKSKIETIFPNIENCLEEIRKYAKEDIIIVGYYNPIPFLFNTSSKDLDELFAIIDSKYQEIAEEYDCTYISFYQLFKKNTSFLPNPMDIHPNLDGYKAISEEILKNYLLKEK